MNLRTAICPRKARKTRKIIGWNFRAFRVFRGQEASFAKMTPLLLGIHEKREKSLGEIFVLFVSFMDKKPVLLR